LRRKLAPPCHVRPGRAFPPRDRSRRGSAIEGTSADGWETELERWLEPFLARLRRNAQRRWAPFHLKGLWRTGPEGPLEAELAALRVRVADGPVAAHGRHLPGDEAWLVGEHRADGERKHYLSDLPADAPLEALAALIEARWVCEQAHQQLEDELGLDHSEGRSWPGCTTTRSCACSPSPSRSTCGSGGKSAATSAEPGPPPRPSLPAIRRRIVAALTRVPLCCPRCRRRFEPHLRPWT
jgi:hypothetical protein